MNERLPLTRIAEIEQHLAATTNWSLGNLAARDLLAELYAVRAELRVARGRVTELEAAAREIVHLHKDSPMGPCPVCIDGDAMVRGDDYTLPYPCPTARLAGAKDCDPPSHRTTRES